MLIIALILLSISSLCVLGVLVESLSEINLLFTKSAFYVASLFSLIGVSFTLGLIFLTYSFPDDTSYCDSLKAQFLESRELSDYYVYHVECE